MMTYERNEYVKSQTVDLSRQIDTVLDHRHEPEEEISPPAPKEPKPISFVRTMLNGLNALK